MHAVGVGDMGSVVKESDRDLLLVKRTHCNAMLVYMLLCSHDIARNTAAYMQ